MRKFLPSNLLFNIPFLIFCIAKSDYLAIFESSYVDILIRISCFLMLLLILAMINFPSSAVPLLLLNRTNYYFDAKYG